MSSVQSRPTPFAVPPQLISFKAPRRSFTVLNSGPKPKSPMFVGNILTVPPVNEVGPHTDTDADGDTIPGSRVIEDYYVYDADLQEEILVFDAVRATCHVLGLQPGSDGEAAIATGPYALGGLSLLPRHAPKSQWKEIAAAGERRAFVAEVERAKTYMRSVDEVNAIRKANGLAPAVPDMFEWDRAQAVLAQFNALVKQETVLAPHQMDELDDDLELEVRVKAAVMELAAKAAAGRTINKEALFDELMADSALRVKLQKRYQIRKRGEQEPSKAQLAAKAKADVLAQAEAERQAVEELKAAAAEAKRQLDEDEKGSGGDGDGGGAE